MTTTGPGGRFVKSAWALLLAQLAAAAVALAVTAWAMLQVRPLLAERQRLEADIAAQRVELGAVQQSLAQARSELKAVEERAAAAQAELQRARQATPELVAGINAFHKRDYNKAIEHYVEAIRLNPGDAYTYNLMSYSQFKTGDVDGAVATMSKCLEVNPAYDWGYFDLARYQCAADRPADAVETLRAALQSRGPGFKPMIGDFLQRDGELRRLCASVLPQLWQLSR
jgi:tetratricopeptide (TPR) repeat protein